MIHIARPMIGEEEIEAVVRVMRTGNIAQGEQVFEFEREFAAHFGHEHAAAVSNGTVALHVALLAAGVKPGDRVLTTPFSFVATTNAILYCGAIPCFVDIEEDTFNISPEKLKESMERWPDAKHLLIVHLFGQSCDMDAIMPLVGEHGLSLIEDCAQSHGATWNGKPVGSFGVAGTFSFYPTKNMTTGEGGMLTTESERFLNDSKRLINHGSTVRYVHEVTGFNYRMTNIGAAIGLSQLDKVDDMNEKRKRNARFFLENIKNVHVVLPVAQEQAQHVYHQFTLRTDYRDQLVAFLAENGIGTGIYYPIPINQQQNVIAYMSELNGTIPSCPVTERVAQQVLSIPVHPQLTEEELNTITTTIDRFVP